MKFQTNIPCVRITLLMLITVGSAMAMVRLKDGSEVPVPMVTTTMIALEKLSESFSGILILDDLVRIARRDPKYRKYGNNEYHMKILGLLNRDGSMHDIVRHIIINAVVGDGFDMRIISPVIGVYEVDEL